MMCLREISLSYFKNIFIFWQFHNMYNISLSHLSSAFSYSFSFFCNPLNRICVACISMEPTCSHIHEEKIDFIFSNLYVKYNIPCVFTCVLLY